MDIEGQALETFNLSVNYHDSGHRKELFRPIILGQYPFAGAMDSLTLKWPGQVKFNFASGREFRMESATMETTVHGQFLTISNQIAFFNGSKIQFLSQLVTGPQLSGFMWKWHDDIQKRFHAIQNGDKWRPYRIPYDAFGKAWFELDVHIELKPVPKPSARHGHFTTTDIAKQLRVTPRRARQLLNEKETKAKLKRAGLPCGGGEQQPRWDSQQFHEVMEIIQSAKGK